MIELTQDLSRALQGSGGGPIRLTDPATKETFVLLREDDCERLKSDSYDAGPWTQEEMDLLAQEDADRLGWEGTEAYQDGQP